MLRSKLLIFKVGNSKYACNIISVDRIIKYENLTYVPSKHYTFEGVYNHEGSVIKIFNLAKILGADITPDNTHKKIIIAKDNDKLVGLVVDEVLEVFNYNKADIESTDIDEESSNNIKGMILIDNEIIRYLSIGKIVEMELEESDI